MVNELHVQTEEEGIALALRLCAPGEAITIHEAHCVVDEDPATCTCSPTVLRPGATA